MRNFVSKPEQYGKKYDSIFESSLQSPISETDRLQYLRSMFDDIVRSYLTDEDRQEIAEEFFAKGVEQGIEQGKANGRAEVAKALLADKMPAELVSKYTGLTEDEVHALL